MVEQLGAESELYRQRHCLQARSRIAGARCWSLRHSLLYVAAKPLSLHCINFPVLRARAYCVELLGSIAATYTSRRTSLLTGRPGQTAFSNIVSTNLAMIRDRDPI